MRSVSGMGRKEVLFLLAVLLFSGCSSLTEEDDNWVQRSFYDLSYNVPPSWVPVRTEEAVEYSRRDTEMNRVRIERFSRGDLHPGIERKVDPSANIFKLADLSFEAMKTDPGYVRVERKKQSRFPPLGRKAFQMKVQTMSTEGVDRMHWIIGGVIDQHYYRIVLEAEQYGHLSTVNEEFVRFKTYLHRRGTDDASAE